MFKNSENVPGFCQILQKNFSDEYVTEFIWSIDRILYKIIYDTNIRFV